MTRTRSLCAAVLMLLAALAAVLAVGGCEGVTIEELITRVDEGQQTVDATAAEMAKTDQLVAALDQQIAATPDGEVKEKLIAQRAELVELQAAVAEKLAVAKATLERWKTALEQVGADADATAAAIGTATQAAAPLLPPPWNAIALLVGSLVTTGATVYGRAKAKAAARTQTDAESIVKGIEAAKANGEQVDFANPDQVKVLKAAMTDGAIALVEAVRGKTAADA